MRSCAHRSTLPSPPMLFCFFFNDTATTEIYTLSLHDALPISCRPVIASPTMSISGKSRSIPWTPARKIDRKSTRLNSSHLRISYVVFCLKKKKRKSEIAKKFVQSCLWVVKNRAPPVRHHPVAGAPVFSSSSINSAKIFYIFFFFNTPPAPLFPPFSPPPPSSA